MQAHSSKVQSFEYLTRMTYYGDDAARKGAVEVLAKRPGSFRFEALDPAGANTIAVLATDCERFMSHERGKSECAVGKACPANLARLLPLAFECEQLFELLGGGAPLILHDSVSGGWDDCEGAYRVALTRKADQTVQQIWLRPDTFGPVKVKVTTAGKLAFEIDYDEFEKRDDILLPRKIRFKSPARDTDLGVEIREQFLNSVDTDVPFKPVCPAGTLERELQCR